MNHLTFFQLSFNISVWKRSVCHAITKITIIIDADFLDNKFLFVIKSTLYVYSVHFLISEFSEIIE